MGASTDVTAALRRTHDMMAAELARSAFARQTLDESTAALRQLDAAYGGLDGMLASSRDLLGTLLRSQKTDTWYLETSLYLLLATLGWLIFRRWLYGPLWWVVWMPARILWGTGKAAGRAASGLAGGGGSGGASMGVVSGSETKVVGMAEEGAVPTVKVGHGQEQGGESGQGDPDSMIGKVGQIVDGQGESEPNPKKRMWEEDVQAAEKEANRIRDEL